MNSIIPGIDPYISYYLVGIFVIGILEKINYFLFLGYISKVYPEIRKQFSYFNLVLKFVWRTELLRPQKTSDSRYMLFINVSRILTLLGWFVGILMLLKLITIFK